MVDFGSRAVVRAHNESFVVHVQDEILPLATSVTHLALIEMNDLLSHHHGEADEANISAVGFLDQLVVHGLF